MKKLGRVQGLLCGCFCMLNSAFCPSVPAFEGRIHAVMIQGNETNAMLYTVRTDSLRVEMTATNWPNPVDILDINSGRLTLLFPNNRSFVHLKPATNAASPTPGVPGMLMPLAPTPPGLRRDEVASATQAGIGPQSAPAAPAMPAMPNLPAPPAAVGPQSQAAPALRSEE